MRFGKTANLMLGFALLTGVVSACSTGGEPKEKAQTKLKIMHYDENSFFQQYGMLFSALHPEVELEVVSTRLIKYEEGKDMAAAQEEFIAEQKPDVLMLTSDQYSKMASEGKLYNLDNLIKKTNYDLAGIVPGIVDYIKEQSDGILYGLTPSFYSTAIYYNKDLFNKHGVSLPQDRMSWDDLLQLAARFPTDGSDEDRVYGLKMNMGTNLYYFALSIGTSQGLSYINPTTRQLTINSDSWKRVFETAHNALKSGALYEEKNEGGMSFDTYESFLLRDPFIGGKVAMTMEGDYLMNQLKEVANSEAKDKAVQNWDLITMPVDPQNPEVSTSMSVQNIFAIDAKSANPEAAWDFISYITSDEFARVTSKSRNGGGFPARVKYVGDEGKNMAAFYSLKPSQMTMYKDFDKLPRDFSMQFDGLVQQELQSVTEGRVTVSEALDNLQAKGQQLLAEAKDNEGVGENEPVAGGTTGAAAGEVESAAQ